MPRQRHLFTRPRDFGLAASITNSLSLHKHYIAVIMPAMEYKPRVSMAYSSQKSSQQKQSSQRKEAEDEFMNLVRILPCNNSAVY